MKKLLLAMFCAVAAQTLWASDAIFLLDGSEIEAQVSEITQTEIKYKKVSNLNGPLYTMPKDAVFMIKYENGEKDVFFQTTPNEAPKPVVEEKSPFVAPAPTSYVGLVVNNGDKPVSVDGRKITLQEYLDLAQKNCATAYKQYMQGVKLKKAGNVCLSVGVPLFAAGLTMYIVGACQLTEYYYGYYDYPYNTADYEAMQSLTQAGAAVSIVGGTVALGSIPFYVVGKNKRRNSFATYNKAIMEQQSAMALEFTAGYKCLGVALKF
jgi:hypothetical protein